MSCDTQRAVNQTAIERKAQVKDAIDGLVKALAMRSIRAKIDPRTGAIAFDGWTAASRKGISDACAYRLVMQGSNALAKAQLAQAGPVNLCAMVHSHDGGRSWEPNHK